MNTRYNKSIDEEEQQHQRFPAEGKEEKEDMIIGRVSPLFKPHWKRIYSRIEGNYPHPVEVKSI